MNSMTQYDYNHHTKMTNSHNCQLSKVYGEPLVLELPSPSTVMLPPPKVVRVVPSSAKKEKDGQTLGIQKKDKAKQLNIHKA